MRFDPEEHDSEQNDYFDGPDIPEPEETPQKPAYTPEDPDYWEEESEWEHLKPATVKVSWLWAVLAVVVAAACGVVWFRFFSPCVEGATQFGYVESIEQRGTIFNTYEGTLIPYREMKDTTRIYDRNFDFTAADKKTALKIKKALHGGYPVRVEYKRYHATLPWRGCTPVIVVSVDSVDPATILPPEFAPKDPSFTRKPKMKE